MARAFRFLRVGLPIVRLARVGLILLRLSDRLVHRMGRLLNRNIVLFEPLHAQKPESSDRHRLIAPAQRGRTRAAQPPWRGSTAIRPAGSGSESWAISKVASSVFPTPALEVAARRIPQPRDTGRGRGRAPDPDDARAAPRSDGTGSGQGARPLSPAPRPAAVCGGSRSFATWSPTAKRARPKRWRSPPTTWAN